MDPSSTPANPKAELTDKLKSANNILVTVSRNPSVDQLASCIGLTLLLNKQGKHAAAVFSGEVPSTIEFLQPEDTLEKNTDSLRDFIIALDKSKADKLRYKVEDQVVRIFITPYKTSISQDDLDFSQGDFNVDLVVALGVQDQDDLDEAITAHGRILHDATVATVNNGNGGELGSINWNDATASSLCELVTTLAQALNKDLIDEQIATALLTGIVAETARFSNEKTTSTTMSVSAALMTAGANQQLVASRLDDQAGGAVSLSSPAPTDGDQGGTGSLEIDHDGSIGAVPSDEAPANDAPVAELPAVPETTDDFSNLFAETAAPAVTTASETATDSNLSQGAKLVTEPPELGGTLTANTQPEGLDPTTDPLSLPTLERNHLLEHEAPGAAASLSAEPVAPMADTVAPATLGLSSDLPAAVPGDMPIIDQPAVVPMPEPPATPPIAPPAQNSPEPIITGLTPPPPAWVPPNTDPFNTAAPQTLSDIEASVKSDEVPSDAGNLDAARDEVSKALSGTGDGPLEPIQALNAQPMTGLLHDDATNSAISTPATPTEPAMPVPVDTTFDPTKFGVMNDPEMPAPATPTVTDSAAPPPVPPPIPFQFNAPADPNNQSA